MIKKLLPAALALGLVASSPVAGHSQEARPLAGQKPLRHEVSVTLKLIQVYVTDKKGDAVTDLEKADFSLSDNGRKMEITEFERHVLDSTGIRNVPPEPAEAPPPAPLLSRKYYFIIDFARNDVFGVEWSRDAALRFLEKEVVAADEVAVIVHQPVAGLVLFENLTTDHARIREVIQKIRGVPGYGLSGGIPLRGEGDPAGSDVGAGSDPTGYRAEFTAEERAAGLDHGWEYLKDQAYRFTRAMQDLAKALRYVQGFKNLIFFSSGIRGDILGDLEDSRVRTEYESMIRELASANCSIFSVNAEGQRAFLKNPLERGTDSLKLLSDRSGGRYFHDVKQADRIASEIRDMTGNFYVLGYYIDEARDGKFHEVRIEVGRPGCRVTAQEGYFSPEDFRKSSKIERDLHLYDLALSDRPKSQAPFRIPLVALPGPGRDGTDLLLLTEINIDRLDEIFGEAAEMISLVFDDRNEVVFTRRGEIRRKSLDPRDRTFTPYVLTSLRPGPYKCRIVFRNLLTGRGAVGAADILISEKAPSSLAVQPPLLFVPDNPTFYLSFSKAEKKDAETEIAPLKEIFPLITGRMTPVLDVLDQGISRLILVARYSLPVDRYEVPEFKVLLTDGSTGEVRDVPLTIVKSAQGQPIPAGEGAGKAEKVRIGTFIAEIVLPAAGPGQYELILKAEDKETAKKAEAVRKITIR